MDGQSDLSLQRSRLYAAAGLLPPPPPTSGLFGGGIVSESNPTRGLHDGAPGGGYGARGTGELSGSAASAMSSLAQLQSRYLPESLAYHHGQGSGYSLMSQYFGGGGPVGSSTAAQAVSASDQYKALMQSFWSSAAASSTAVSSHQTRSEGLGHYGVNAAAALYAPSSYPSLLSHGIPPDSGAPYHLGSTLGPLQANTYHGMYQLQKEMLHLQSAGSSNLFSRMVPPPPPPPLPPPGATNSLLVDTNTSGRSLLSPSPSMLSPSTPLMSPPSRTTGGPESLDRTIKLSPSESRRKSTAVESAENKSLSLKSSSSEKRTKVPSSAHHCHRNRDSSDHRSPESKGSKHRRSSTQTVKLSEGYVTEDAGSNNNNSSNSSSSSSSATVIKKEPRAESSPGQKPATHTQSASEEKGLRSQTDDCSSESGGTQKTSVRSSSSGKKKKKKQDAGDSLDAGKDSSAHHSRAAAPSKTLSGQARNGQQLENTARHANTNTAATVTETDQDSMQREVGKDSTVHSERAAGTEASRGKQVPKDIDIVSVSEENDTVSSFTSTASSDVPLTDSVTVSDQQRTLPVSKDATVSTSQSVSVEALPEQAVSKVSDATEDRTTVTYISPSGGMCYSVSHSKTAGTTTSTGTTTEPSESPQKPSSSSLCHQRAALISDCSASAAQDGRRIHAPTYTPEIGAMTIKHSPKSDTSETRENPEGLNAVSHVKVETDDDTLQVCNVHIRSQSKRSSCVQIKQDPSETEGEATRCSREKRKEPLSALDKTSDDSCEKVADNTSVSNGDCRPNLWSPGRTFKQTFPSQSSETSETDLSTSSALPQDSTILSRRSHSSVYDPRSYSYSRLSQQPGGAEMEGKFILPIDPRLLQMYSQEDQEKLMQAGLLPQQLMWPSASARTAATSSTLDGVDTVDVKDQNVTESSKPEEVSANFEPPVVKSDPSISESWPSCYAASSDRKTTADTSLSESCRKTPTGKPVTGSSATATSGTSTASLLRTASGKDKVVKPMANKDSSQGTLEDNSTSSGSIPVGIAIARQRNANTARIHKPEGWRITSDGHHEDRHHHNSDDLLLAVNSTASSTISTDSNTAHDVSSRERDERTPFHRDHKALVCSQDRPVAPDVVTSGQDTVSASLVLNGGLSSTVPWETASGTRHGTQAPTAVHPDPWGLAPPQPMWGVGQPPPPFTLPPPPHSMPQHPPPGVLDPAHIPYSVPAGYKLAQDPMTGQVYLIPDLNWGPFSAAAAAAAAAAASARGPSHPLLGCLPPAPSSGPPAETRLQPDITPAVAAPVIKKDIHSRPQSVNPMDSVDQKVGITTTKPRPRTTDRRRQSLGETQTPRDEKESDPSSIPQSEQSLPVAPYSHPHHLPYLYSHSQLLRDVEDSRTASSIKQEVQTESRATSPFIPPDTMISTGTCTNSVGQCSTAVQTGSDADGDEPAQTSREMASQTSDTEEASPDTRCHHSLQCTCTCANTSLPPVTILPAKDVQDLARSSPPILTKISQPNIPESVLSPLNDPTTTEQQSQAADGLQMLCIVAEKEWTHGTLQDLAANNNGEPSPDINKNYNAPKASFFDSEDFVPLKQWPARKEDTDLSSMLKINSGLDAMEPMEIEMRMRLAELQRKYREKQRQLAKLQPKKDKQQPVKRGPGRPCKRRNKRSSSTSGSMSPPTTPSEDSADSVTTPPPSVKKVKLPENRPSSSSKQNGTPQQFKTEVKSAAESAAVKPSSLSGSPTKKATTPIQWACKVTAKPDGKQPDERGTTKERKSSVGESHKSEVVESFKDTAAPSTENLWYSSPHGMPTSGLGLLAQFATARTDSLELSVAAATSAALKSKKRKKLPDGSGLEDYADHAPVKKRKPGRPKKYSASKGVTETLVARKYKNYSFLFMKAGHSNIKRPKLPSPVKTRSPSFEAEWNRRRSERIFLNEPCTPPKDKSNRPSLTTTTATTTTATTTVAATTTIFTTPRSFSTSHATGLAALKNRSSNSSSSKIQGKVRNTVHDLSQKVKKKYSKPAATKTASPTPSTICRPFSASSMKAPSSFSIPAPATSRPTTISAATATNTTTPAAAATVASSASSASSSQMSRFRFSPLSLESGSDSDSSSEGDDVPLSTLKHREEQLRAAQTKPPSCVIDKDELRDKLRVLYLTDGLFYEAEVKEIQPPDVYGIMIEGERGNRPHILSQEDLLKQAVLDVNPEHPKHIPEGTRVCAYWSQQFTCLYPGTISSSSPDPKHDNDNLVCVEFDDGDSGRIPLEYIRMLPADFPIQDLDTIPLMMVGKRRRSTLSEDTAESRDRKSSFSDRRLSQGSADGRRPKKRGPGRPTKKKSSSPSSRSRMSLDADNDNELWIDVESVSSEKEMASPTKLPSPKGTKREAEADKKSPVFEPAASSKNVEPNHNKSEENARASGKEARKENDEEEDMDLQQQQQRDQEDEDEDEDEDDTGMSVQGSTDTFSDEDDEETEGESQNEAGKMPRKRLPSDSRSKIAAFLPARQLWRWSGPSTRRPGMKGRAKKDYFKAIKRGKETIRVGDAAVFLSTGRPHLPYVGRITSLWQGWGGNMVVKVKWFYHPEETKGGKRLSEIKGALYQSPHQDENDVQTISHRCEVISYSKYKAYRSRKQQAAKAKGTVADLENDDVYYLAGTYDPTAGLIKFEADVKLAY